MMLFREQDFLNYLSLNDYRKAIQLALAMEQPGRLFSLFKNIRSESASESSITGHRSVDEVIRTLGGSDLAKLLRYVRDWNANAKTSGVAQGVLFAVVKLRSADDVMKAFGDEVGEAAFARGEVFDQKAMGAGGAGGTALKELMDALIPYTERHLSRMERLVQESYMVDYILSEMDDGMFDGELADYDVDGTDTETGIGILV
jgi:U3 small nucleolar RNA-associated protein 13